MAKSRKAYGNPPVKGGVRRRRTTGVASSSRSDASIIRYSTIGDTATIPAADPLIAVPTRHYAPGYGAGVVNSTGPDLVGYYSTGKFLPGTRIRWEPNVAFTTPGRVFVGFTDNPEVISQIEGLRTTNRTTYASRVKGLSSVISFPVWQETEVDFPMKMRRKRFDINETLDLTDNNAVDRSAQVSMFACIEGAPANTQCGSFWYHDIVDVEGIHPQLT